MFERLVLQFNSSDDYLDIMLLSLFFTLLSVFLVRRFVPFHVGGQELGGIIVVLLASLSVAYPFVQHLLEREQEEAQNRFSEKRLLRRHFEDFMLYLSLFLGSTVAFAFSTFFVPESFYSVQMQVLRSINAPTGSVFAPGFFMDVLMNNLGVFTITFVLAFFISSGILFVLLWNASVLGIHIGSNLSSSLFHVPFNTLPFLPHGIPEIGGYILAGIAGALLSFEAETIVYNTDAQRWMILKDVIVLTGIGALFILAGAFIESLTPL